MLVFAVNETRALEATLMLRPERYSRFEMIGGVGSTNDPVSPQPIIESTYWGAFERVYGMMSDVRRLESKVVFKGLPSKVRVYEVSMGAEPGKRPECMLPVMLLLSREKYADVRAGKEY